MANEFVIKNGLISKGNGQFTGSVTATNFVGEFTGSLRGSASYSLTASYALNSTSGTSASSSWASSSISSSYALNAGTAYSLNFKPVNVDSSSYASSSVSSSYSLTASYANIGTGTNNYFPIWNTNRLTATSSLYQSASAICIGTTTPDGILHAYKLNQSNSIVNQTLNGIVCKQYMVGLNTAGDHTGTHIRGLTSIVGEGWGSGGTGSGVHIAPWIEQYQSLAKYTAIHIDDIYWTGTGAGTVTGDYYGIYQKSSTPKNYFAGNVGIGYSGSEYKLRIHDPTQAIKLVLGPNYLDGNTDSALQVIQVNQSASNYAGLYLAKMGNCGGYILCNNNGLFIGDTTTTTTPYIYCGIAGGAANRVGIGTIAPLQKLDVSGSINIPNTIDTSTGIIYKANTRFIHNYQAPGTDGNYNTFVGISAGNTTMAKDTQTYQACYNTALGFGALSGLTTGHQNTAVGFYSLLYNSSGYQNVAIGYNTLQQNTDGYNNVAIGHNVMLLNTGGYANVAIGLSALYANTNGYQNSAIGVAALYQNKTGYSNVAIGSDSQRLNVGAVRNVSVGVGSLYNNTGSYNTSIGDTSMPNNTIGALNTAVGVESAFYNSSGSQNVFVGAWAGYNPWNNIAQYRITDDSNMVLIGAGATKNNASTITNGIAIGMGALVGASNQVVLGNIYIDSTFIRGITYHNNFVDVQAPMSQSSTFIDQHYPAGIWGHQLSHYNGTPYFYQRNSSSWDVVNQISTNGNTYFNGTGNVSIGTAASAAKLHVNGNVVVGVQTSAADAAYSIGANILNAASPTKMTTSVITAPESVFRMYRAGTAGVKYNPSADFQIGTYAAGTNGLSQLNISLGNGSVHAPDVTVMSLLGNGNVGIGTSAPGKLLHVQGEISCSNLIGTASYALAGVGSSGGATTFTVITASTGTIPILLDNPEQMLYLTASSNITFSMVSGSSTAGKVQETSVYFKNTSGGNVGVYFPTTWINLGGLWPTIAYANKSGILILRSIDNTIIAGTYNAQI